MSRNLLIGILLAGALSIATLFTWPIWQDYQLVTSQLADRELELENRDTYFQDLERASLTLSEFPDQLAKVEAAIPNDANLPSLYGFLQQEASLSGLSLGSISAVVEQPAEENQTLSVIPVNLEVTGSYAALKEFLSRLQTASRVTSLQTLSVAGSLQAAVFSITMQIQAYSY